MSRVVPVLQLANPAPWNFVELRAETTNAPWAWNVATNRVERVLNPAAFVLKNSVEKLLLLAQSLMEVPALLTSLRFSAMAAANTATSALPIALDFRWLNVAQFQARLVLVLMITLQLPAGQITASTATFVGRNKLDSRRKNVVPPRPVRVLARLISAQSSAE